MERHSFRIVSGESRKLCLSTKFPYQEIRWNYGISTVTGILKIIMRDVGIIHYSLFSRKNNSCSGALLKIHYCDAGGIYTSLGMDKMLLLMQLSLNLGNRHTWHFKVTSENKIYSPQKINWNKHAGLSLLQNIPCVWDKITTDSF